MVRNVGITVACATTPGINSLIPQWTPTAFFSARLSFCGTEKNQTSNKSRRSFSMYKFRSRMSWNVWKAKYLASLSQKYKLMVLQSLLHPFLPSVDSFFVLFTQLSKLLICSTKLLPYLFSHLCSLKLLLWQPLGTKQAETGSTQSRKAAKSAYVDVWTAHG